MRAAAAVYRRRKEKEIEEKGKGEKKAKMSNNAFSVLFLYHDQVRVSLVMGGLPAGSA